MKEIENNGWHTNDGRMMIVNGGIALKDCPTDWDKANEWKDSANGDRDEYEWPTWSWDCGFKLDFDGPILSICSRFYPPKTHSGNTWDGTVTVYLLGKEIEEKKFDCPDLETLRIEVESYLQEIKGRITLK